MRIIFFLLLAFAKACTQDSECSGNKLCKDGDCQQKGIFPLTGFEILGTCLVFVSSGLAGASGIGGGALFVVFFVILFYFNSSESVALSQFTIVGSSVMASFIKLFLKHPAKQKPLINFDIIVIIICPLLIGTTIGVIVNISLPYWVILLILTGLLGYLSIGTFRSGIRLFKKETSRVSNSNFLKNETSMKEDSEELKRLYEEEKKKIPLDSFLIILAVYSFVVFFTLIKGSSSFASVIGVKFCSAWYWVLMALMFAVLGLFSYFNSKYIIAKYKKKVELGYDFDSGDVRWEEITCLRLNIVGFMAGFLGAIIGVGGALIINPTLIKFNVRPEVMTATGSFMIVFTSSVSALQFLISGRIQYDYGLWTITFSLMGSALGVFVIKGCVDKYKRSSLITLTLACVMVLSGIVTPVYGIYQALTSDYMDYGFHDYCDK